MAQGVLGSCLRSRIILTFRHYEGGRSSIKSTCRLYPRRNPWYSLSEAESTSEYMVLSGKPRKKPRVTSPGIDPRTVRIVAQRVNTIYIYRERERERRERGIRVLMFSGGAMWQQNNLRSNKHISMYIYIKIFRVSTSRCTDWLWLRFQTSSDRRKELLLKHTSVSAISSRWCRVISSCIQGRKVHFFEARDNCF